MNTPICDFVENYAKSQAVRLHMPGHKGKAILGFEQADITEICGADSLFEAEGIIAESERNASALFGSKCFYSTEGSSLVIRAMLYLFRLWAGENCRILAARNCHKAFLSAVALLDLKVDWLYPAGGGNYLSCPIDLVELEESLANSKEKTAVYITSPDYLGNIADLESISKICKKYDARLLVDNAHGAYLKFLPQSRHPIDLGASMCCDSAHKTLPVLTGGAYLHIAPCEDFFISRSKDALALFGSTSPSYLILQSLDKANQYIANGYGQALKATADAVANTKALISEMGFTLYGSEPLKITILPKSHGQSGLELANILHENNVITEFSDNDAVVLMLTPENSKDDLSRLLSVLKSIPEQAEITENAPQVGKPESVKTIREALMSNAERISAVDSLGRIFAGFGISCPPAVPLIIGGERVDENILKCFEYYGINQCLVIKGE